MIEEIKIGDKNVLFARHNGKLIYPKYASTENLVLHYDFSGRTNLDIQKGIAEDLSGNGNNGVLQNFAYTDDSGYLDNALIFDDIDDFITIPKPMIDLNNFTYSEGIKVLSFRGDEVATVVDGVVEIGGRNLISKPLIGSTAGIMDTSEYSSNGVIKFSSSHAYGGVYITAHPLLPNTEYVMSYRYKKTSGTLVSFGGHTDASWNNTRAYVDGVGGGGYSSGSSVFVADDDIEHEVVIYINTPSEISVNHQINIQPNRGSAKPIDIDIYDLKLEKGTKVTDRSPAPEELGTTIFKPFFDKKIKSALYWNRALTDEELLQVYNTQIKRT